MGTGYILNGESVKKINVCYEVVTNYILIFIK